MASATPAAPVAAGAAGPGRSQDALGTTAGGRRQRPICTLSAFSCIPARRKGPPELSYFHREAKTGDVSTYDAIFKSQEGYNQYVHRCDRKHAKSHGLNVNEEEMARPVAVLSSSEYGRRVQKPIEMPIKDHARVNHLQAEFYMKNGIPCLTEKPSPSLDPH